LHAGCGSGQVDVDLVKKAKLTAIDISPKALEKYKVNHDKNVEIIHGDIFKMPFKNNFFEIIFNLGVMEHFNENQIKNILTEFKRTLTKDGKLILFWPPKYGLSVMFLKFVKKIIFLISRKNITFHPHEITLIKSKKHAENILNRSGFKIIESYFGIRDFFTHQIIVAKKQN
jgi:ubiquinone/menaquinone biosynthesis C-methylase UbiE